MSVNKVSGTTSSSQQNQSVISPRAGTLDTDFESFMKDVMKTDKGRSIGNRASEEELFSGLVQYQVKSSLGDEKLAEFQDILLTQSLYLQDTRGVRSWEEATRQSLLEFQARNSATEDEVNSIYSTCFSAAQLDSNTDALWDRRGDTKSVMKTDEAIAKCKEMMGQIESNAVSVKPLTVGNLKNTSSNDSSGGVTSINPGSTPGTIKKANPKDGAGGFVFKPKSDSDGKLAIILPPSLTGKVDSVTLKNSAGDIVESGKASGVGNGGRATFRYSKSGGSYPQDLVVEVLLKDGSAMQYDITDPSKRWD